MSIESIAQQARLAGTRIGQLSTLEKNAILALLAKNLDQSRQAILSANARDIAAAEKSELSDAMIDRLVLNDDRITAMIQSVHELIALPDYVGEIVQEWTRPNGLHIVEKRVGFGVIAVIYESRPNVTIDVGGICLKSGSSVILKGGKEARHTNEILVQCLARSCEIPDAFQLITTSDRKILNDLMEQHHYIDLVIPRGGAGLIQYVRTHSQIPVIETGTGNCHIYVDASAVIPDALAIIRNAKTQRPSVCNACETVLVHSEIAAAFLPRLAEALLPFKVEIRGCAITQSIIPCKPAVQSDWETEFLGLVLAVKVVLGPDQAIAHINQYGSRHSEAILSQHAGHITRFQNEIDAAVVYSNASTRFTDGGEFGFGAEIGISTQKLHARGPMGLKALTTTRYLVTGNGHVRS